MRGIVLGLVAIWMAAAVGCATSPSRATRVPPASAPPAAAGAAEVPPGSLPPAVADAAVDPQGTAPLAAAGVEAMESLTLERALEIAERGHPAIAAAAARIEAAEGRALQAGLFPNPQAIARFESAPFRGRTGDEADVVAGLSQRLPIGGRLSAAREVEDCDRRRLEHERDAVILGVRARVRKAFAAAQYGAAVVEVHDEGVRIAENGVRIARARHQAGDAAADEAARAEAELAREQIDLDRARRERELGLQELSVALGIPGAQIAFVAGDLSANAEADVDAGDFDASRHPALVSALAGIARERARIELAEKERVPDVTLDLLYRRLGDVEDPENGFDVGAAVAIPLFDRNQGAVKEARGGWAAAQQEARAAQVQVEGGLRISLARLTQAREAARRTRDELLPRLADVLKAAEARYAAGDAPLVEVLPVRRDWVEAKIVYLEALREFGEARAEVEGFRSR